MVERSRDEGSAAQGFAGNTDRQSGRSSHEIRKVRIESVEIDDRARRVDVACSCFIRDAKVSAAAGVTPHNSLPYALKR